MIIGIVISCLILIAFIGYAWWYRYVRNRRKNLVLPKPIVMMRPKPPAIYQKISKHCRSTSTELAPFE